MVPPLLHEPSSAPNRIDGIEVLRRIRAHEHTRLLPAVVLAPPPPPPARSPA